jgi:hypothetical protein
MLKLARRSFIATPLARSFKFPAITVYNIANIILIVLQNEPMLHHRPGSVEREALQKELVKTNAMDPTNVPIIINGESIIKSNLKKQVIPSRHADNICLYSEVEKADGILTPILIK